MPELDAASVPAGRSWRRAFVALFALLQAAKILLAALLPPFADEAFYWQESRRLAWGYSDLPGLTAWLIRFGQSLAGDGVLAMRWPFLALGVLLPWLVTEDAGWLGTASGWAMVVYLALVPTVLAYRLFARGLTQVPASTASTIALAEPVVAMVLGVVLLDERLSVVGWIGAALVLTGLVLVSRRTTATMEP